MLTPLSFNLSKVPNGTTISVLSVMWDSVREIPLKERRNLRQLPHQGMGESHSPRDHRMSHNLGKSRERSCYWGPRKAKQRICKS